MKVKIGRFSRAPAEFFSLRGPNRRQPKNSQIFTRRPPLKYNANLANWPGCYQQTVPTSIGPVFAAHPVPPTRSSIDMSRLPEHVADQTKGQGSTRTPIERVSAPPEDLPAARGPHFLD